MRPSEAPRCETANLPWTATGSPGVECKYLAGGKAADPDGACLVRLSPGARLPATRVGWGLELLVLEGTLQVPGALLSGHDYARRPAAHVGQEATATGCVLFVRAAPFADAEQVPLHVRGDEQPWHAGHGNLRVKSLHSRGDEGTAFVHWPTGERFVPHRHWGGEEIFVLSGTFEDEHGRYPVGTWLQNPHLSTHHPFVREETVIFVKTGHLLPAGPRSSPGR